MGDFAILFTISKAFTRRNVNAKNGVKTFFGANYGEKKSIYMTIESLPTGIFFFWPTLNN